MKKLVFALCLISLQLFANDKETPSKIKAVKVYLNGAQITRTAQVQLKAGTTELKFSNLSTHIDESSISVSGLKGASILALSYGTDYLKKQKAHPEIARLETELEKLEAAISKIRNQKSGLEEELKTLAANRDLRSLEKGIQLESVKSIAAFYRERTTAIKNEIFDLNGKLSEKMEEEDAFEKQLAELNNLPEKEVGVITLKLSSPALQNLNLTIEYQVDRAGWVPNYDIRSASMASDLKLTYKAHVYQKTGVDWDNVKISLSTGSPSGLSVLPELGPKYLNFVSNYSYKRKPKRKQGNYSYNPSVKKVTGVVRDESGLPLPGVNVLIEGTNTGTQTDFDGKYDLQIGSGQTLRFSYIGMHEASLPIYSSVMNVSLEEDAQTLDEVVVTAMGVSRPSNLEGYASGVQVRGNASVKKEPLYIIDGIPNANYSEGDLDENSIQDVEILKGNSATALYGSQASNGVFLITTKKSHSEDNVTQTDFNIVKPYSIASDGDITAIEVNTFKTKTKYEYIAVPVLDEAVFLTAILTGWESYDLLPGEASVYFKGNYAGKTALDPYGVSKELKISLGTDPKITVKRQQRREFKSKNLTGSNRVLDRTYDLEIKNNKSNSVNVRLLDRVPLSQNKEIKVNNIETPHAQYDEEKGILTWSLKLSPGQTQKESFSFQIKYPKGRRISL